MRRQAREDCKGMRQVLRGRRILEQVDRADSGCGFCFEQPTCQHGVGENVMSGDDVAVDNFDPAVRKQPGDEVAMRLPERRLALGRNRQNHRNFGQCTFAEGFLAGKGGNSLVRPALKVVAGQECAKLSVKLGTIIAKKEDCKCCKRRYPVADSLQSLESEEGLKRKDRAGYPIEIATFASLPCS